MNLQRFGPAPLIGLIATIVVLLSGCDPQLGGARMDNPPPTTEQSTNDPVAESATAACGEASVSACKTRGAEALNSLPADRRGDENTSPTPANFNKELQGLEDKPENLERAVWLVKVLVGFKTVADSGTPTDQAALAAQLHALLRNATQADVNVGSQGDHAVDWALNAQEERGSGSFTKRTLKTPAEVGAYLNEDTPESKEAKAYVVKAIKDAGYGDDEVARALTGEGYIPIQIKDASQVLGTSYFKDGKVLIAGKWRQAGGGDVYWLYITRDGKLIRGALVRADCGNPDAIAIMVVRPGMPSAPPIEQPPGEEECPPGTTPGPDGRCYPPTSPPPPPPSTHKRAPEAPGQGGVGDGGDSQHGGTGGDRQRTDGPARPPAAGDPPAQPPTAPRPAPNPVPSATPAPPQPTQPPATGAPSPSQAPTQCVPPPGMPDFCN